MPDMSKPGAHIQSIRDEWEFRIKENRKKARDLNIEADTLERCCFDWDDALRKEDEKLIDEAK